MDTTSNEWEYNPTTGRWEPVADYVQGHDNLNFKMDDEGWPEGVYDGSDYDQVPMPEPMPEVKDIDFKTPNYSEKMDLTQSQTNTSFEKSANHYGVNGLGLKPQTEDESEDDSEGNPKTFMRVLTRFADRTSMQGVPYINVSKVWYAKACWSILFIVGFVAMCFHLYYLIQEYYAYKTHSVVSLGFNTLTFPAVTVCNVNPIKASTMGSASEPLRALVDSVKPSQIVNSMEEKRLQDANKEQPPGQTNQNSQQPPQNDDTGQVNQNSQQPPQNEDTGQTNTNAQQPSENGDTDKTNTNTNTQQSSQGGDTDQTNTNSQQSSQGGDTDQTNTNTQQSSQGGDTDQTNTNTQQSSQGGDTDQTNTNSQQSSQGGDTDQTNTNTQQSSQGGDTDQTNTNSQQSSQGGDTDQTNTNTQQSSQGGDTDQTNTNTQQSPQGGDTDQTNTNSQQSSQGGDTDQTNTNTQQSSQGGDTDSTQGGKTNSTDDNNRLQGGDNTGDVQQKPLGSGLDRAKRDATPRKRRRRFVDGFSISETNTRYQPQDEDKANIFNAPTGNKSTIRAIEDEFKFLFSSMERDRREAMGHQIDDMLMECTFRGIECDIRNFKLVQTAEYGNCYTIESDQFVSVLGGPADGMNLIFFLQDEEYLHGIANSLGFQVQIHGKGSMPNPYEEGLSVPAGMESFIGLKQVNIERLGDPFGECEEGVQFEANYGLIYTQKTCQQFCIQELILQRCRCFDTEREEIFRRLASSEQVNGTHPCLNATESSCLNDVYNDVQSGVLDCGCLSPCEETMFTKSISAKQWPTTEYASILVEYLCGVLNETECANYESKSRTDLASSFLKIVIYFEDLNYENITEEENYELFQFVSDIGGTIGLWIGLSLISFFEVLQFIFELIHFLVYVKPRQRKKVAKKRKRVLQQQAVRHAIRFANNIMIPSNQGPALHTVNSKLARPRSKKYSTNQTYLSSSGDSQSPGDSASSRGDKNTSSSLRPPPFDDVMKSDPNSSNIFSDIMKPGTQKHDPFFNKSNNNGF